MAEPAQSRRLWDRFDDLSLRWQIGLFAMLLLLLSLLSFGYFAFSKSREAVTDVTLEKLAAETGLATDAIDRNLKTAASIALQVRDFPPIPGIFRSLDNDGMDPEEADSTTDVWIARLAVIITAQMKAHPEYRSGLFLGEDGSLMMSISRDSSGQPQQDVSPATAALRTETFQESAGLRDGEVFISRIHSEAGDHTIEVAVPCFDQSERFRAVFLFVINGSHLFQEAADVVESSDLDIVDDQGQYVFSEENPDYARSGRMYEKDKPVRAALMEQQDGPQVYQEFLSGANRPDGKSLIASFRKLHYAPQNPELFLVVSPSLSADAALAPIRGVAMRFVLVGLLTAGLAALAIWLFSGRITEALHRLAASADRIAEGDLDAEVPEVRGIGEVRTLAESLKTMTGTLRRIVKEAEAQQQRTRAILNSTADGIITIDERGRIQEINQLALSLFGYDSNEVVGQDAGRLVPVLTSNDAHHDHSPLLPGEVRSLGPEAEVTGRHRSGSGIPVALRVTQIEHLGERLFIATVQDITERHEAEAERTRLFEGIGEAVRHLSTASSEIVATTTQQARSAQEQASSVTETATTVEELTQTAEQARGRAEEVAQSARRADEVSQSGRAAVDQTFAAMEHVREQVESTAESILALAERAQAISEIISTVDDLADQTNLLAINASIEASRAGEHGKGFAVVATEIKALAEQSKKATDQVRQILGEIQQATNTAVISTEQGTRTVEEARQVVRMAEETITKLAETISGAARSASQIVASSGQQAVAMQQINEAMSHIDQATKQTLAATRQAEQSAADLNDVGQRLRDLIEGNGRAQR